MATKLKNLKVSKVDFVDEGANPGAHIRLFKRKDSGGQPEGEGTGKEQGNVLKKLLGFIGKAAGMGQDEIDTAVGEIQKSGSYSFNERLDEAKNRKIADEIWDLCYGAVSSLLYAVVMESKPIIVDYGVIENTDNYAESDYQNLAKAFLKEDLLTFYNEMAKSDDLAASILMNAANMDSKDFPNKKDNNYHYVNRNVYVVNGNPLVGDDFPEEMGKDEARAGFSEVLAAIRAENVMLSEDDKISEKVSKAMAVQYIINYSLGLVGEYKDLSILELQPTANIHSDLEAKTTDRGNVVRYIRFREKMPMKCFLY